MGSMLPGYGIPKNNGIVNISLKIAATHQFLIIIKNWTCLEFNGSQDRVDRSVVNKTNTNLY